MPNRELLLKKLAEIVKQLENLKKLVKLKQEELFGNEAKFYFAERVMERLIGAAIDINMHLASDLANETPADYFQSFITMGKLGVMPGKFSKQIAPSTSLRNILAHEYQSLDTDKFHKGLKLALNQYRDYAKYVEKFLRKS